LDNRMRRNLLMLAGCVPLVVLFCFLFADRWRRKRAGERPPQQDKLLRPAGHSLSLQIADLGDSLLTWMLGAYLAALAAVGLFSLTDSESFTGSVVSLAVSGVSAAVCIVMAWRTEQKIRTARLGLLGEQAVAEQLQGLWAKGCRVFHDVPGGGKWNLDHVVVGPSGVFAIETKARTKRPGRRGERDYEAVFDGKAIRFPNYTDTNAIPQAERNARWLAGMLSKATGEPVGVTGLVALPGWFVTLKTKAEIKVLNAKQIPHFIAGEPRKLSDKVMQQIAYQLEQRCRDVEF